MLVNSLITDKFRQFVNDRIVECNEKVDEKRGNKFPVLATMAKIFKDTKLVSSNLRALIGIGRKGRFHQLIKSSKKKRIEREEKKSQDKREENYSDFINTQKDEIYDLKEELNECKARLEDHEKDTELLKCLYDQGIIDIDGKPVDNRS